MKFETPDGVAIGFDMLASFAVTSFAGNSELSDLRIPAVTFDKTRLSLGDMAIHAGAIPCSERIVFLQLRWDQECLRHRRPHFFCDNVSERKQLQGAALARLQP